jgi:hypothetical protein
VITQLPEHSRDNVGEFYYKSVLEYLVQNLKRTLTSETTKESFNEATSQHRITVSINDKQNKYWDIKFNNGALEISHKANQANLYEVGSFNLEEVIPSPGLPLVTRLNIEKYRESLDENLQRINSATGEGEWSVEIDFEKILPLLDQYQQKNVGEQYYKSVMEYLASNIEQAMKSETIKEAFNEATSQRKIIVRVDDKQPSYWILKFENGALVVSHKKNMANMYEIGSFQLANVIPSPGLPLVTRLNIEAHKEDLESNLERIRNVTGESWEVEVDFEKAIKVSPDTQRNIGEVYYKSILEYLASNLERTLKNETTKEAFLEATNQRKIIIRPSTNPKESKYWNLFFENGALVVQYRKELANLYEIGSFNLESVMPVPGVLSLLARLNIQESQEKLQESLEKIKQATGEEYSVDDSCLEACYKAVDEHNKNRIGENLLQTAMTYLADNISKRLQDDMVKEAFNETATAHQIIFRPDAKAANYWQLKFENGAVVVIFKPNLANMYELGSFDIEKLL